MKNIQKHPELSCQTKRQYNWLINYNSMGPIKIWDKIKIWASWADLTAFPLLREINYGLSFAVHSAHLLKCLWQLGKGEHFINDRTESPFICGLWHPVQTFRIWCKECRKVNLSSGQKLGKNFNELETLKTCDSVKIYPGFNWHCNANP